ncbi:MAG: hypothetical protein RJA20_2300 [Bacteroidota bacterium]
MVRLGRIHQTFSPLAVKQRQPKLSTHGFSRGATRVPRCRSNHKSPARENTQMVKIPEIPGVIRPCHRPSSSGSRSFSPRLQPWETRHERPCPARMRGASHQARGYPIGMPVEKATPRKKGNIVQPTDRRIPPLLRPPNSGSRSRQPTASAVGNARRNAVPREDARREPPSPGLPNRDAREKSHHREKKTRTWFSQQTGEYPLSLGGQTAAAAALTHGFSRGKRATSGRTPRGCPTRETMPCVTQS